MTKVPFVRDNEQLPCIKGRSRRCVLGHGGHWGLKTYIHSLEAYLQKCRVVYSDSNGSDLGVSSYCSARTLLVNFLHLSTHGCKMAVFIFLTDELFP